ncbi:unnamed protein product [Rotaria magnacalcarata]|uniref:Uncharacterized protein n=1 Tax=Rotaria magnacalcarata TaxID=392030 RepID=A0A815PK88_9BILA|nr:unnamed protein product [Rotaria magnacalcarata]CAF2161684.1 unnamed protein product [Rotaria magnacalcarata]CAF4099813.1 unnamed protein product [Rotaria magnacalcarata]CAF4283823.1 unnamed protein product [Rotaria magnacalcarata]CAF4468875.1 unnamed protein product [Rotaria magnacalcarata]
MENPRYAHTASLLTKGKILVTGGWGGTSYLNSAELYDISVGNWATTGNMNIARECHTSSVLPNGNVTRKRVCIDYRVQKLWFDNYKEQFHFNGSELFL